jgi:glycosyltransferase involved in cell wall biosynthesis
VLTPKIAIVHDWLTTLAGQERVTLELHNMFPNAPVYTSVFNKQAMPEFNDVDVRTTYLQKILPKSLRYRHILWPVLRSFAFPKLDLFEYDIIISNTTAEAKAVKKRPGAIHICYCNTPVRYYWSHYEEFKRDFQFGYFTPIIRPFIPLLVTWMRKRDLKSVEGVDVFIANSTAVQARIKQYYGRSSTVIHPPVETSRFEPSRERGDYYVALGRQVPYKRIDLAVAAATILNVPLRVYGNGAEHQKLVDMAGPKVRFYTDRFGDASDIAVATALDSARGYIFPAEEDFGIVQVEALAAGAPVIAYAKGGALDIVQDGESGVIFNEQTVDSLVSAIKRAETITFLPGTLRRKAKRFDTGLFVTKINKIVSDNVSKL